MPFFGRRRVGWRCKPTETNDAAERPPKTPMGRGPPTAVVITLIRFNSPKHAERGAGVFPQKKDGQGVRAWRLVPCSSNKNVSWIQSGHIGGRMGI